MALGAFRRVDRPQLRVDLISSRPDRLDRVRQRRPVSFVIGLHVVGHVVDEATRDTLAELGVLTGVEDERVPADIDQVAGSDRRA
ncbi:hypothetical protein [Krasilnikovia sp. MM14-A1004]|uniref:hypothetical protein n=1 Tax=Krasilnikovia sp. MM14-A1004 TaxID=3373541 RepID=UPI00399CEAF5